MLNLYQYGTQQDMPHYEAEKSSNDPALYKPSKALQQAVNIAIALGKPLLLTGEPGTGKTQLAHSIAHWLKAGQTLVFNTRTTSTANDIFYRYDSLKHFQYAQRKDAEELSNEAIEQRFIRYAALGEAIKSQSRRIVLIDEVDKAPRDLPNDILNVLEEMAFDVPEIGKHYKADPAYRPVVILTSNSEKNLPDAFLRRCVFHHIQFPSQEELLEILKDKRSKPYYSTEELEQYAIPHFMQIRDKAKRKKPSTSELLYWIYLLEGIKFPAAKLAKGASLSSEEKQQLESSYGVLIKVAEDMKHVGN